MHEGAVEYRGVPLGHLADAQVPCPPGVLEVQLRELVGLVAQDLGALGLSGLHRLDGEAAPVHKQLQAEGRADGDCGGVEGVLHSAGGQLEGH
eukprot:CAMPEP_0198213318 /NCGR_PEP_ID=MMETSP1445-20131203/28798_1 /TAXON_ID=36898 /ORGANISM="Pyramimonas sp., Strain CCMP2087" /LENGTH=92 /DNA_ID=CAMNT_0043887943 /DNA_START=325 /DNA_END=600 /DNA_ORIENTATION=+